MEAPAPYHIAPKGPRNLAVPLAAWLREQGFTATEHHQGTTVAAHWVGPQGERFQFDYAWVAGPVPSATCWLDVLYPGQRYSEMLFKAQQVRRLKDARLMLTGNVRYANARTLAQLLPTAP